MKEIAKIAALTFLSAMLLVSCGGEQNKSGGGSSSNPYGNYPGGATFGGNGTQLPGDWVQRVINENPCYDYNTGQLNNARTNLIIPLQGMNVNANSMYAGVTYEGDVGVVTNRNGQPVIEVFACRRPDLAPNSRGYIVSQSGIAPVLNVSRNCGVGEITAMDIAVETAQGGYIFKFYPIYLGSGNSQARSSICQY